VQQLAALPTLWWALLLIPLLFLAWRRPLWLVPVCFVAGVVWVSFRAGLILEDHLPSALEGRDLVLEGSIADLPIRTDFGWRFPFDVARATHAGAAVTVPARVLLSVGHGDFVPRAGDAWRLTARLKHPHGLQNPGGFDYEAHLFRNRLRATGYVRLDDAPQRLDVAPARHALDRLRQRLGSAMRALLPDNPFAGIVVALANGDGGGVRDAQWDVFRRSGTLHLVAISGLHISLVGGLAFFLGRFLWALPGYTVLRYPAPVVGAVCAIAAAAAYSALAGFVIPTQRALIMLTVAMSGILLRREIPPTRLLAIALFAVLAYDPLAVMAAGFWLSFAAVAVILFVAQGGSWRLEGWRKWGYLQLAIGLGMLPLMFALFQQASLVAPLANLLAVPVFDLWMVPLTLAGVVLLDLWPAAAQILFELAAWLLAQLWPVLDGLAALPGSQWTRPALPLWTILAAALGVAWLLAPRGWPARWVGAVWLLPLALWRAPAPAPGEVWFTLLDVGQGLSAVVRTAGHTLVFDTGPRYGTFDTGRATVAPFLRAQGVARVDLLVVSHGDNDHLGGADSLRRLLPVEKILSSVPERVPGAGACAAGQQWEWDGVRFAVLNPPEGQSGKANDQSCVLHVRSAHGRVLLPADIEARTERRLVAAQGERLRAEVLVVPHHGSKTSSTGEFLAAVKPEFALFPVGYRNRFRHPHPDVVARYDAAGVRRLDSAANGAIDVRLSAAGTTVSTWRERRRRYWHYAPAG
jgi:competence protein ComEC